MSVGNCPKALPTWAESQVPTTKGLGTHVFAVPVPSARRQPVTTRRSRVAAGRVRRGEVWREAANAWHLAWVPGTGRRPRWTSGLNSIPAISLRPGLPGPGAGGQLSIPRLSRAIERCGFQTCLPDLGDPSSYTDPTRLSHSCRSRELLPPRPPGSSRPTQRSGAAQPGRPAPRPSRPRPSRSAPPLTASPAHDALGAGTPRVRKSRETEAPLRRRQRQGGGSENGGREGCERMGSGLGAGVRVRSAQCLRAPLPGVPGATAASSSFFLWVSGAAAPGWAGRPGARE